LYKKASLLVSLYGLQITKPGETRQAVWLDSLAHAREWLAGTTLMRIAAQAITLEHIITQSER